jgi:NAD dependent epimerase/dehydratase family enzyme
MSDEIAAIRFLLARDDIDGPVNLAAPQPVRNVEWVRAIGAVLHRPTALPVPAFALRAAIGEFADEGPLISQRVLPHRLLDAGFGFAQPTIGEAIAHELR